jgi:hypothetical protein
VTEVTTPQGVRTGACVVRAEADGRTGLRITVTARLDVEDLSGERRTATTSMATAVARVREFLETFALEARSGAPPVGGDASTSPVRKKQP